MEYEKALKIAKKEIELLKPFCEKIEVAGSLRREKQFVNDIEICCVPKTVITKQGLFESEPEREQKFIDLINSFSRVRGNGKGKYCRYIHKDGIDVDLFMTTLPQWGVIFMIRTGSAEYSKRVVTEIKPKGYFVKDGFLWGQSGKINTPEEEDFYKITGMEYIKPAMRIF